MDIKSKKAIHFEIQTWKTYKNVYGKYKFTNYILSSGLKYLNRLKMLFKCSYEITVKIFIRWWKTTVKTSKLILKVAFTQG